MTESILTESQPPGRKMKRDKKRKRREREQAHVALDSSVEKVENFLERKRHLERDVNTAISGVEVSERENEKAAKKRRKLERRARKDAEASLGSVDPIEGVLAGDKNSDAHLEDGDAGNIAVKVATAPASNARSIDINPGLEDKRAAKEQRRALKTARNAASEDTRKTLPTNYPASSDLSRLIMTPAIKGPRTANQRRKEEKAAREAGKLERKAIKSANPQIDDSQTTDLVRYGNYTEHPTLTTAPSREVDSFVKTTNITVVDPQTLPLRPILDFQQLPSTNLLCHYVLEKFSHPTAIQSSSWPYAFAGRDVIGIAETGSGKTLAFGLPLARHISTRLQNGENSSKTRRSPMALVVSPTRELALQIHEQLAKLGASNAFNVACVYGGVAKEQQTPRLRKVHCAVATPGRLRDYIGQKKKSGIVDGDKLDLSRVKYVVLDEADRMLDTGFEEDIRAILAECAEQRERQTLMYTATWPLGVRTLASTFMSDPVQIQMGDRDDLRANAKIMQQVEVIGSREKNGRMIELLKEYTKGSKHKDRILVFCLYKKEAARIEDFLRGKGFQVSGIHGDMNQAKRTESLEAFKSGEVPILVATDVAARGLDIPAVKLVLNVTFPLTVEDYVHRIGRTGRAGQEGQAITFFTENEKGLAGGLINVLKAAEQHVPEALLKFGSTVKTKSHDVYGRFVRQDMEGMVGSRTTFD